MEICSLQGSHGAVGEKRTWSEEHEESTPLECSPCEADYALTGKLHKSAAAGEKAWEVLGRDGKLRDNGILQGFL